ncbi:tyrosine-type recombinase/integrase [Mucilaginibacter rubeus]|uniref:Tyrosine-type recombinase/integrase n=1 Tax=Mucilaginibacter rubeus TaxID=2027860 RepID=A0AAE6JJY6_9SPHI|nr:MULTISPECIES: tyrosine-type recombinase/integrase [Mucilaginibacter]QEM07257.1 tyrosine-type recombinase/integrase [Mucilaginibacter rubeus]QEM19712.1 tyrosine-type recombinase/integrase [Mucilaginibacter gossypii]QTE43590.1 tyrosine-type recombinase/integrase [Mucilaginibacter rubeus]QTE50190.1 tyrosine-type recombinase/integrase [Mucilaginibacter rubeus]QTE55278.1 tyrosine-type recombinase/integrase [Mucilaginibacter rubeus]
MKISTTPIIWTYRKIKDTDNNFIKDEHEVRVRMWQNEKPIYIPTGFSSSVENWDKEHARPKTTHPKFLELSSKIKGIIDDIEYEIKTADKAGRVITHIEIKANLGLDRKLTPVIDKPNKIMAYAQSIVDYYNSVDNPGYANVFYNCKLTLKKLLKDRDKMFLSFTKADHEAYEQQITGLSESTISNYLRTYYRIWNLAIEDGLCTKNHHPKKFIKFKAYKRIRTKKRSIKSDYWDRIMKLKPSKETRIYRSHLMMQFMYYGRGMNFNDMLKLKREQFVNNGIVYRRSKNKRSYDFELHPKAVAVVKLLENFPEQSDAGYIFPFIMQEHDTAKKIDARIDSALKDFNEDSQAMADAVGWKKRFTSNALRHGFASHLNEANVPIKIIQEALGHETQLQTRVYLDDIEDGIITSAINAALK